MKKKHWIHYGICVGVALIVFLIGIFSQGLFEKSSAKETVRVLSDSFLFPGVLLGGIGALSWIASEGTFDMLSYGFAFCFSKLIHPHKSFMGFYEYKMEKSDKREGWLVPELIVGLLCIAVSAIFVVIYMML